jgi:hypothetical protein
MTMHNDETGTAAMPEGAGAVAVRTGEETIARERLLRWLEATPEQHALMDAVLCACLA